MTKFRIASRTSTRRIAALLIGVGTMFASSACMTVAYSTEELPTISVSRAKRDLGVDYLSTRRTGMAIRELAESLALDPTDPATHLWLGEAYRRKGRTEKAEAFLLDSLRIAKRDKDITTTQAALLSLSALLSQMGRFEDAIPHCEALSNDPTFSTPWRPLTNCGWALIKLGRLDEARGRLTQALDFFPRFGPALLNLGILEEKQGHRLAAVKSLNKALASGRLTASAHAEANYRLGEIFVTLGKRDRAVEHFRVAAKIAPEADWGSESQAYLDLLH
jgi:tetratricopeptide (TPR) repeat protein